jgi:prepilin-type N-terminal cleavage/methylation domain-containing protein
VDILNTNNVTDAKEPSVNRSRPKAFSLIELLIVIGLIAILSSLLLIGVGKLITNSKRQATQLAFQNCQAMYSEWDRVSRMHFPSLVDPAVTVVGTATVATPSPQNVTLDYFNSNVLTFQVGETSAAYPDRQGFAVSGSPPPLPPGSAVMLTRDFMSLFRNMPVNAAAMGKLSARATMIFTYPFYPPQLNAYAPPTWALANSYVPLDRVQTTDAAGNVYYYVCIRSTPYTPPGGGTYDAPLSDTGYWLPAVNDIVPTQISTVPVLLDGWGDPIIFVSGGLLGATAPNPANLNPNGTVIPGTGAIQSGSGSSAITLQVKSPDGRPFWASAGPDGDFSQGDDNMYSFEK